MVLTYAMFVPNMSTGSAKSATDSDHFKRSAEAVRHALAAHVAQADELRAKVEALLKAVDGSEGDALGQAIGQAREAIGQSKSDTVDFSGNVAQRGHDTGETGHL